MRRELDDEIRRAIEELNSLLDGERAVSKLIALGEAAKPALREFLLKGKPRGIYQPRRWAVEALAGLGAKDALLEYLRMEKRIADPVVRMGEEAVENEAARQLGAWRTGEVFEALLDVARERRRAGVLEALGQFGRPEATPYLISALEDDVCRSTAENAVRRLGATAKPQLIIAALTPWPDKDEETPSSLRRRTSAVRLLAELRVSPDEWCDLRPLTEESDPFMLAAVGSIAASAGEEDDEVAMAARLIAVLERADWSARMEIEEVLAALYEAAEPAIEQEISRRGKHVQGSAAVFDPTLSLLSRVKRRAKERCHGTGRS